MKSMNKVQLVGYLGADPVLHTMGNGNLMMRFRVATNKYIDQQEGEAKQITSWHDIRIWNKRKIEKLKDYLIKGSHVLIEGELTYRTFLDKAGHKRYMTEIRANSLVDLDR